jgi:hypothetical protein
MKNSSIALVCITLLFLACKDKNKIVITPTTNPLEVHPTSYIQKIILENFAGEWCGSCVYNNLFKDTLKKQYADRLYVANIHNGDWLEIPYAQTFSNYMGGVSSFPQAAINRLPAKYTQQGIEDSMVIYSPKNWIANIVDIYKKQAQLGIACKTGYDNFDFPFIDIYFSYKNPIQGDTRVMVYAVEDDVKSLNQNNADSNYLHQDVVKNVISSDLGDSITLNKTNDTIIKRTYKDISFFNVNKANVSFIVFVYKYDSNNRKLDVLNVQKVKLGATKLWN